MQAAVTTIKQVCGMLKVSGPAGAFLELPGTMQTGDAWVLGLSDGSVIEGAVDGDLRVAVAGSGQPRVRDGAAILAGPIAWAILSDPTALTTEAATRAYHDDMQAELAFIDEMLDGSARRDVATC